MKAVKVFEAGGSDVLTLVECDKPSIKAGWSLIKVMGFGINRSEILTRQGHSPSVTFPRILGIECVGVIAETSDAEKLPIGSRVVSIMGEMGRAFDGSYAEYVLVPNEQIYQVKTDLAWEVMASIPETYYTAFGSMNNLKLEADDSVLVRGATSGVGLAFVKLLKAKHPDLRVVGTSRQADKLPRLLVEGFDDVVLERDGRLLTEEKFSKILDLVGAKVIKNSLSHLRSGGIVCVTGLLGGAWFLEDFDPIEALKDNLYLTTFHSSTVTEEKLQELFDYIGHYQLKIEPERVFALEDIKQAHDYLDSQNSFGKVVVIND